LNPAKRVSKIFTNIQGMYNTRLMIRFIIGNAFNIFPEIIALYTKPSKATTINIFNMRETMLDVLLRGPIDRAIKFMIK
jgi:hypothetical protein